MSSSSSSSSSFSSSVARTWRTAFLTLRDETLTRSPKSESKSIVELLHSLIFSHSQSLISAASDLPPHEVTSDLLFLMELAAKSSHHSHDFTLVFSHIIHLMHDICHRQSVPLQLNNSSWTLTLDSFATMLAFLLSKAGSSALSNAANIRPSVECLETVRLLAAAYCHKCSVLDNIQLVKFLLQIIECSCAQLSGSSYTSRNQGYSSSTGKRSAKYCSLWEIHTVAFTLLGEAFERVGSSCPAGVWQSTIEVLRKVMDILASKSSLVDDIVMSRFYASLLNCLHLVLMDPKGPLHDHISGFVATLRMFFIYGLNSRPQFIYPVGGHKEKERKSFKLASVEPIAKDNGPYRPPHLRQKDTLSNKMEKARESMNFSDQESYATDFASSDSDCSDSDGAGKDAESVQSCKVRVAAVACIQDLCQADPKSFTTQWTMLLPTNEVLQPRKFEATLMTCLLFDPYLKARISSASTLAVMLDGPSSIFLQVAEYKESTKWGSFMALSSSLGHILMQLHTGILYLIQRETHGRLLASSFKVLTLLISSTPYSRMPGDLLPTVIRSLVARIENGFPFKNDQTGLLSTAINCLTAALSTSSSSPQVKQMLSEETLSGAIAEKRSGALVTIFQYSEQLTSPKICFEALQALRGVIHNYPTIAVGCWEQVSTVVSKILRVAIPDVPTRAWKGHVGDNVGFIGEKVITSTIKVLDECLRALSGFKGTEDLSDDKLLDTPFASDCVREKKISSAPLYDLENEEHTIEEAKSCQSGSEQWCMTIENLIPLTLWHSSAMVRTASVTCFAGITSSVFISLTKEKQEFIVSSLINAAVQDEIPSVRSAACRAIGVMSCFPQISQSAEILDKFIHAIETNTHDPSISVRIPASWALANICDSFRHCIDDIPVKTSIYKLQGSSANSQITLFLTQCALRLTKDGDKIKSNAVRALGNLSRFVKPVASMDLSTNNIETFPASNNVSSSHGYISNPHHPTIVGHSRLLEKMVQAFLSCVTTGNVKVQWNVCHALSNLFLNESLRLQEMEWAPSVFSILLLLLRDSSNFKIRIQAAAALAVPMSVSDYGKSFSDVVHGLEHILENLNSDHISAPSSFKYRAALGTQVTVTMLHVLSLVSSTDHEPLKDFLVKKASFLEGWFKNMCSSLGESSNQTEDGSSIGGQKKQMILKAIQAVIEVYESRNLHAIAQKFQLLSKSMQ